MMPMSGANPAESPANEQSESVAHIVPDPVKMAELRPQIMDALATVYDPEIPVNITELGLIYDVLVDAEAKVGIRMTLSAPACPAAHRHAEGLSLGSGAARHPRHFLPFEPSQPAPIMNRL